MWIGIPMPNYLQYGVIGPLGSECGCLIRFFYDILFDESKLHNHILSVDASAESTTYSQLQSD
jgi:hypothetical protein